MKKSLLASLAILLSIISYCQQQRLPLKVEDMYPNVSIPLNDIAHLFDDDPSTQFSFWNPPVNPVRFTVDLSDYSSYVITTIKCLWNTGNPSAYRIIGVKRSDGTETLIYAHQGGNWIPVEQTIPISNVQDIKMLIIESPGGSDYPDYLKLYGTYTESAKPLAPLVHYPLRNFMMANCHPYDTDSAWYDADKYPEKFKQISESGITGFRMYDDIDMIKDTFGNYAFEPTYRGGFVYEQFYGSIQERVPGFLRHFCLQGQSYQVRKTWQQATGDLNSQLDAPYGLDRSNPLSWTELARDGAVAALRYGTNKNGADYPLHVGPWYETKQNMLKGANLVDMIEPWNEDNAWWSPEHCLSTPEMFASMSAFYDGHKGVIPNAGVKVGDPSMLVSSGGVASSDGWILHEGSYWSIKNRGYRTDGSIDFPFDVWQFHDYPSGGGQYSGSQGGLPPELSLVPTAKNVIYTARKYAGGIPCLMGEAGWDIHPNSPINAPAFASYSAEESRAMLAIRMVFKSSQIGLYGIEWFSLFQDGNWNDANETQFATMALLWSSDDGTIIRRRTIADYFKQITPFRDYVFAEALRDDSVQVLRFTKAGSPDLYAAWMVEDVTVINNRPVFKERRFDYKMNITGMRYDFTEDSSGVMKSMPFQAGTLVTLSSKPILFTGIANIVLPVKLVYFRAEKKNRTTAMNWKAEGAHHYEVERSSDGAQFSVIGTTFQSSFTDNNPNALNYYRLKVVDFDGTFVYSKVAVIRFSAQVYDAQVFNAVGQLLMRKADIDDIESFERSIPYRGVLFIRYTSREGLETSTKKLVK